MPQTFHTFDRDTAVLVVVLVGEFTLADLQQSMESVLGEIGMQKGLRILVDHRRSPLRLTKQDIREHVRYIAELIQRLPDVRAASVVTEPKDYGLLRMFEMLAELQLDRTYPPFTTVEGALDWLELSPEDVSWPEISDGEP